MSIQEKLDLVLQHHIQGRLTEAQNIFQKIRRTSFGDPQDLQTVGLVAMQIGLNDQALELFIKAVTVNPEFASGHYNLALAYHALGLVEDSISSLHNAIAANPKFADPYNILGSICIDLGQSADAIEYLQKALSLNQDHTFAHYNLGNAYMHTSQYENAETSYKNAITADPEYAEAHYNHGNAFMNLEQYENAETSYTKALALKPNYAEACFNLGTVQYQLGQLVNAIISFQNTINIKTDYYESYNNQAVILKELERFNEAKDVLESVISLNPEYTEAYKILGDVFLELERFDEAIECFDKAISLDPKYADAYINLGLAYEETGLFEESVLSYKKALNINFELSFLHMNIGNAYKKNEEFISAIECYQNFIDLIPEDPEGYTKLGSVQRSLNRIDEAIISFEKALKIQPDYLKAHKDLGVTYHLLGQMEGVVKSCREINTITPENTQNHSTLIFSLGHTPGVSGKVILEEARRWDVMHGAKDINNDYFNTLDPDRRLRIGYVSADFRNHAVAFLLEPLLIEHNRDEIELYCYAEIKNPDYVTKRFMDIADHWRLTTGLSDDEMNAMIRNDRIDIIIECTGHTSNNRLVALSHKPAPIQINYFPMHGQTLGMESIEYVISDHVLSPPEFYNQFSEEVIIIEHGAFNYRPKSTWLGVSPPRDQDGDMVFACVGDPARIGDKTIRLWSRLLELVPEAKLLFKHPNYKNPYVLNKWRNKFVRFGERVSFDSVVGGWERNMDSYNSIDVVLDTVPMTGGTSCIIPLWMGVPVVTMESQYVGHRVAMCILTNSGVPEFIAKDEDDYLKILIELIYDRDRLNKLRLELRDRIKAAPIFNSREQAKDIENAFRRIWINWCSSQNK